MRTGKEPKARPKRPAKRRENTGTDRRRSRVKTTDGCPSAYPGGCHHRRHPPSRTRRGRKGPDRRTHGWAASSGARQRSGFAATYARPCWKPAALSERPGRDGTPPPPLSHPHPPHQSSLPRRRRRARTTLLKAWHLALHSKPDVVPRVSTW